MLGATLSHGGGHLVQVETCLGRGLSRVLLVGMPDAVAREARERLPAAFARHGLSFPKGKVLFNLVPAEIPKRGLPLDLALAVSLLQASGALPRGGEDLLFLAELDLEGGLRPPARGTLLAALAAAREGIVGLVTARGAVDEARLVPGLTVYGCDHLGEVLALLRDGAVPAGSRPPIEAPAAPTSRLPRLDELRGQEEAHQAAALAAIGRLNLWLEGPPGTGKSMLARRLVGLRPLLDDQLAMEVARVEALLGPVPHLPRRPPFRAPHASVSAQALLGGGRPLRPGEVSRAHGGILLLDEIPEFSRPCLEGLRQPLEDRCLRIQRAQEEAVFPADILVAATANPCPCGFLGHPRRPCRCSEAKVAAYRGRLSGPLRDRFDLFVRMDPAPVAALTGPPTALPDEEVQSGLAAARRFQERQETRRGYREAADASLEALQGEGLAPEARRLLREAQASLDLSGRGILRCLRAARAAADLRLAVRIELSDLRLALRFRPLPTSAGTTTASPRFRSRDAPRPTPRRRPAKPRPRPG